MTSSPRSLHCKQGLDLTGDLTVSGHTWSDSRVTYTVSSFRSTGSVTLREETDVSRPGIQTKERVDIRSQEIVPPGAICLWAGWNGQDNPPDGWEVVADMSGLFVRGGIQDVNSNDSNVTALRKNQIGEQPNVGNTRLIGDNTNFKSADAVQPLEPAGHLRKLPDGEFPQHTHSMETRHKTGTTAGAQFLLKNFRPSAQATTRMQPGGSAGEIPAPQTAFAPGGSNTGTGTYGKGHRHGNIGSAGKNLKDRAAVNVEPRHMKLYYIKKT